MIKRFIKGSTIKSVILILLVSVIIFLNIANAAFASGNTRETDTGTGKRQVYSGSWIKNSDKSIYGKDREIQYDEQEFQNEPKKLNFIENMLVELIMSITDSLYVIMDAIGITIDNVIYGRVGGHTKNGIALFRFELQKGNPYGVVGSVIYNIIAGIAIIFLVVTIFGKISIAMYYNSGKKWSSFKSSIGTSLISMALLSLMPPLLDVALYLADVILHVVSTDGSMRLFSDQNGLNIVESFRDAAMFSFVNSLIYLATIILSLYFAAIYIGYALSMVVLFVTFPIICVGMNYDKKLISQWGKQVLSILLIPIMDCILMMIPIYFGFLPNNASMGVIKIFICAMIVPSRNIIRQILGLGSSGLELSGVATMMGAMNLARAGGSAIQKFRGGRKAAKEDANMANYHSEMAMNEGLGSADTGQAGAEGVADAVGVTAGEMAGKVSPGTMGGASSTGKTSYMGKSSIVPEQRSAEKYANINNFESQAFKGGLSHEKMAELYKQRSNQRNVTAGLSALGSVAGGVVGTGSGMFMGAGFSAQMGALGMMAGGATGQMIAENGSTGKSPEPTLYPQPSTSSQPESTLYPQPSTNSLPENVIEFAQGVVVEDTSVQDMSGVETGTSSYKSLPAQTAAFVKNNWPIASSVVNNGVSGFTANNGEHLKVIYEDVKRDNNKKVNMGDESMSNNMIRNEIRNRAADKIMGDFKPTFNNKAKRESDEMANQDGIARMNAFTEHMVREPKAGYLSEDVLDTFDWMPRRDQEGETV